MSIKLNSVIFELPIRATAKLVLLAMADHAHSDGTNCFPSIATLAKKTGLSRRGTQKLVHKLTSAGFLKDTKKVSRFGTVIYIMTLDRGEPRSLVGGEPRSHGGANRKTRGGRTGRREGGEPGCTKGANPVRPNQSLNQSLNPIRKTGCANLDHHQDAKTSSATADDDDSRALPPSETSKRTEVEQYNKRVDEFREKVLTKFRRRVDQDQEFLNAALDVIDQRAWDKKTRIVSEQYFVTALENFLGDESAVADLKQSLLQAKARRERFNIPGEFSEKDPNAGQYVECVRFAVEESERTGRLANDILAEVLAARGIAP